MSLSASQILKTHGQKSKAKKKIISNFTTINFHKGMHSSNFYETILKNHLLDTQLQNHVLSSASRKYENQTNKKFRTRSLNKKNTNTQNPQMIKSQILNLKQKQHEEVFHKIFKSKAERVPQIEDYLKDQLKEKLFLDKKIKQLKLMKTEENKKKSKINLNCNKIMNEIQKLCVNTNKVVQQNFNLNIQIKKITQECIDLQEQVNALSQKIKFTKNRIKQQYKLKNNFKQYNINIQTKLREETKYFKFLKDTETKAIKNMSNNYMYQNQLKQEKALLLASIQTDFIKNK